MAILVKSFSTIEIYLYIISGLILEQIQYIGLNPIHRTNIFNGAFFDSKPISLIVCFS